MQASQLCMAFALWLSLVCTKIPVRDSGQGTVRLLRPPTLRVTPRESRTVRILDARYSTQSIRRVNTSVNSVAGSELLLSTRATIRPAFRKIANTTTIPNVMAPEVVDHMARTRRSEFCPPTSLVPTPPWTGPSDRGPGAAWGPVPAAAPAAPDGQGPLVGPPAAGPAWTTPYPPGPAGAPSAAGAPYPGCP